MLLCGHFPKIKCSAPSVTPRQKERDLELAARIGQSLLKQNQELTARNEMLDEQLDIAKEEVSVKARPHASVFVLRARVSPVPPPPRPDRSAPPRAVHARRPAPVLRQHRGARERRVTFPVSGHQHPQHPQQPQLTLTQSLTLTLTTLTPFHCRIKRNESCSSLSNFVHYDFLQQKLKGLEDENRKLRLEVSRVGRKCHTLVSLLVSHTGGL